MNTKSDFGRGAVWRIILAQSVPMIAAQFIQLLYNIVDRIYIGHLPEVGSLALTGVGLTFPITTLVLAMTSLYSTGGTPLFSIARGAGDEEQAQDILGNVAVLLLVSSILLSGLIWLFRIPVLYLFGASEHTIIYADSYLQIYLLGIPFSMLTTGLNGFINAEGFPKTAMCTTLIGALLNMVLDPLLIFVLGWGTRGAAAATVISQFVAAVWVLRFLTGSRAVLKLTRAHLKLQSRHIRRIIGLGVTGFTQQATNALVQILCNVTLKNHGGDLYVGIMTIVNSIREIASLPVFGLTAGAQPVLGFNYGAKKNDRVKRGIRFMSAAGVGYTALLWLVIMLVPGPMIRLFSGDAETLACGVHAVRLYFMGFVFMSLQFVGQSSFVGLGKAKRAVFFSIFRKVVIVVPLTLLLPLLGGMGTDGVFLAEPVSNLIGGAACFIVMWLTLYRKL